MEKQFDEKAFVLQLYMKAEEKAKEYAELLHELHKLDQRIARTKRYVEQLCLFLKDEGQEVESLLAKLTEGNDGGEEMEVSVEA